MNMEDLNNIKFLNPKDRFSFGCNGCGQCCKNRKDILLNAYDILRLQGYLGISFSELLDAYSELYVGNTSGLPIVRLRSDVTCPFLSQGKCMVQEAKPTVCALFPLGRAISGQEIKYFVQNVRCGTNAKEHTLQDWLKCLGVDNERCSIVWGKIIVESTQIMQEIHQEKDDVLKKLFQNFMVSVLYDGFDCSIDYYSQFSKRYEDIKLIHGKLPELIRQFKSKDI